jgi:hypothetical protein
MAAFEPPKLLGADGELIRTRWHNLYIMVWMGSVRLRHLEANATDIEGLIKDFGEFAVLSLLEAGAKPPDSAAREVIKRQQKSFSPHVLRNVQLIDGQGFWASTIISVVSSLQLTRGSLRQIVVRTPAEAAAQLAPVLRTSTGSEVPRLHVLEAIVATRALKDQRAA